MKPRTTAQDVADLAGVSRSTVSRYFSGTTKVSVRKRDRILAAAQELGYRPNAIARSLTGQRTDLVAVVTTEHLSYQSNFQLQEVTLQLAMVGKRALVIPVGEHMTIDESSLRALDYQVDGIIVMGGSVSRDVVDLLTAAKVPLFLFGRDHKGGNSAGVSCDNAAGGAIAARYLLRAGRRRLAYVGKQANTFSDRKREQGFVEEVARQGHAVHAVVKDIGSYQGGQRAGAALFGAATPPDAVFCFNDTMAFGVLQAARDFKFSVPGDVAVIGFDNQPMAAWDSFDLTSVGYATEDLARLCAERLVDAIERGGLKSATFHLTPDLIVRRTTP